MNGQTPKSDTFGFGDRDQLVKGAEIDWTDDLSENNTFWRYQIRLRWLGDAIGERNLTIGVVYGLIACAVVLKKTSS